MRHKKLKGKTSRPGSAPGKNKKATTMNNEVSVKEEIKMETVETEKKGVFKKASENMVEFAQNRPVVTAFVLMGSYDVVKSVVRGPVKGGVQFVAGKVGGLFGRRAAQATVGAASEHVAHLAGSIVKSIF